LTTSKAEITTKAIWILSANPNVVRDWVREIYKEPSIPFNSGVC